ncbi:JAB domain-containing protein [Candidatus Omnitrophota bacterium]
MQIKIKNQSRYELSNSQKAARMFKSILLEEERIDQDKEHFWVVGLTTQNKIKYIELVTLGILDENLIHPREVFRLAIMKGVASVIVCHNHPSGNCEPSEEDVIFTKKLKNANDIIGINLLDHIIINTNNGYYSFADRGGI